MADHVLLDGFANGWIVNEAGNLDLTIEYLPQRIFYIGLVATLVSLSLVIFFLARDYHEKK